MTNVQLYFTIGLPIFSIVIVWLGSTIMNNRAINILASRIGDTGSRIDDLKGSLSQRIEDSNRSLSQLIEESNRSLGQRIDDSNRNSSHRLDGLSQSLGQRIEESNRGLSQRVDDLCGEVRAGFTGVNERLSRLESRFDHIEDEVRKDHENRLARLEAQIFVRTA